MSSISLKSLLPTFIFAVSVLTTTCHSNRVFAQPPVVLEPAKQQPPPVTAETTKQQIPPPIVQEAVKKQTTPDSGKTTSTASPLQIKSDSQTQDTQKSPSKEFQDYRKGSANTIPAPSKNLPLFGYELFKSAREAIDGNRKFFQRQTQKELDNLKLEQNGTKIESRTRSTNGSGDAFDTTNDNSQRAVRRNAPQDQNDSPPQQNAFNNPIGPSGYLYSNISADIPANYQLTGGDSITIRISSPTIEAITQTKVIDAQGRIQLDDLGYVTLRGQSIDSAESSLQTQLKPFYKNAKVSITAPRLHTIQIFVTGSVYDPGNFSVPAVATAFNLLTIAGGPTDDGTLRQVEVRRNGKVIARLDLYKLLLGDGSIPDVALRSGDQISVPPRRSRVAISGEVLKPAVYELLPNESLSDALKFAGGVRASGLNQNVRVNTVTPGVERIIKDVKVTDNSPLYDGDEVEVFSVRNRLVNRVTIEGAVDLPNDYALTPGMRVSDLVAKARGPLNEAFLRQAELHRWQPDNTDLLVTINLEKAIQHDPKYDLELQTLDRLRVYNRDEVAYIGLGKVEISGAVKRPGIYDASRNMRVSDLLRMAGGPLPDASLEDSHLLHSHPGAPYSHEYVNLSQASLARLSFDPEVLDNDRLIVFRADEARFKPAFRVEIRGEVVTPGVFPRTENMRLSDLLAYSGGLKPSAGMTIDIAHARRLEDGLNTRVATVNLEGNHAPPADKDQLLEDGDVVSVRGVGGYQPEVQSVIVTGAVNKPGTHFLIRKDMRLSDMIREAGGLRKEAFPAGAEFYRDPKSLVTSGQRSLVQELESLNQILNDSVIKQEIAKTQLDLIKAAGAAVADSSGGTAAGVSAASATGLTGAKIDASQLVSPARKFTGAQLDPNGYVAVNLPKALLKPQGKDDITLQNGDIISIPEIPTTVQVLGAVYSKRGVLYEPGKRLDYYIDQAGGYTVDAARDKIEVFHVNGGVVPGKRVKELEPGDVIVIPTKALAARLSSRGNTLSDIFRTITSSAILYRLSTGVFGL